jgi:hypothetical protein
MLLVMIFLLMTIVFLFIDISYGKKIQANQKDIQKNEQDLLNLQHLILSSEGNDQVDISLFQNKAFADYNEVVPFTALLENMFAKVDPEALISIKSQEDHIFTDHFADYSLKLKIKDKETLFKALDELYNSRFITKVMEFSMDYLSNEDKNSNTFSVIELTIRLYLK